MEHPATPVATPASIPETPIIQRQKPPKQEKPYEGFPLFWHCSGCWACKRGGRTIYYEADWKASHRRFVIDEDARRQGLQPRPHVVKSYALRDAVNRFMLRQEERLAAGEISAIQYAKYRGELAGDPRAGRAGRLAKAISLKTPLAEFAGSHGPDLFGQIRQKAIARGLAAAERHIICVRAMFGYCSKRRGMMGPPNYADEFDKPGVAQFRHAKAKKAAKDGERAWSLPELRIILEEARTSPKLHCWILLGLTCGYQAADIAALPKSLIKLEERLLRFPRIKNGIPRVTPLCDQTLAALKAALPHCARHKPARPEFAGLAFLTPRGFPPVLSQPVLDAKGRVRTVSRNDAINLAYRRLLRGISRKRVQEAQNARGPAGKPLSRREIRELDIQRKGAGFNTLRAMFRSLATGASADPDLVAVIMGRQVARPIDEYYLRGDLREQLFKVTQHVATQIWPPTPAA